jgi:hypothetical protein
VTALLPEGRVFRLSFASLVPEGRWGEGPDARLAGPLPEERAGDGLAAAALTPVTVEVATARLPDPQVLFRAIRPLPRAGTELAIGVVADEPGLEHVSAVRLERQLWSWRGRRLLAHFPFERLFPGDADPLHAFEDDSRAWAEVRLWDRQGFADRGDHELVAEHGRLALSRDGRAPSAALHRLDLADDARALYYRYRLAVTSRYADLLADPDRRRARSAGTDSVWKRLVVRCRLTRPLPRPRLRFVLPLTRPLLDEESPATAPLLVLLHETWTQTAGLVERLVPHVAEARETDRAWPEYGFDPIDSIDTLASGGGDPFASLPAIDCDAPPFGLSFDTGPAGLPVTSCFELRLTPRAGAPVEALRPGTMLRIGFSREAVPEGVVGRHRLASAPTAPRWVQLPANADRLLVRLDGEAAASWRSVSGSLAVGDDGRPVGVDGRPVIELAAEEAGAGGPLAREAWLLRTRRVVDAAGLPGREVFHDLVPADGEGLREPPEGLVIRIAVVERRRGGGSAPRTGQALLGELFPPERDEGAPDAGARIRSLSPPITARAATRQ